jgi:hypothetical protein
LDNCGQCAKYLLFVFNLLVLVSILSNHTIWKSNS